MPSIEQKIQDIKGRIAKWGKLHQERVTQDELMDIINHYETYIEDLEREHNVAARQHQHALQQLRNEHNAEVARLNGRIGGLQKRLNKQEKAS